MTNQSPSSKAEALANNGVSDAADIQEPQMTAPAVYTAIAAVMSDLAADGISKGRRNSQQGYNFRGIDDVYNALAPVLAKHRLLLLPRVLNRFQVERTTAKGGALFYTTVEVEFDLVSGVDGSAHTIRTVGEAMDSADKSSNKAMSAAYKYAAMQAFCIPTEGDNDADATTHEVAPRKPAGDLTERAAAVDGALRKASNADALDAVWGRASELCAKLSTDAPDKLALLTKLYDSRRAELSASDFPGDQSTPFDKAA